MSSTTDILSQVATDLREVLSGDLLAGLSDADRAQALSALGEVGRLADAAVVEAVASADVEFGHRYGCRNMNELLQRALLTDATTAAKITRAAQATHREVNMLSGERMPARWPRLREAMLDGHLSIAGLLAATGPIEAAHHRISAAERLQVDETLARYATGHLHDDTSETGEAGEAADHTSNPSTDSTGTTDPDDHPADDAPTSPRPRATPDDLRLAAQHLAIILDPDGAEPSDRAAQQGRSLTIGRLHNGNHPIYGNLTPEVAAQLQLIIDAFNNPKVGGAPAPGRVAFDDGNSGSDSDSDSSGSGSNAEDDPFNSDPRNVIDPRTPAQKRHDALAAALGIAARHDDMPKLGGAAPTLVVHVDATDLAEGHGWATIPGCGTPVPLSVATHTACTGAIQRVLFDNGRIIGITTTDRVFTAHQRRAITLRDKECLVPGCHVPATWCEIHHVTEHARGGPTATDNGVPLCWWHHRTLHTSDWEIRMNDGIPHIRGPAWWDPERKWRTPTATAQALGLTKARAG